LLGEPETLDAELLQEEKAEAKAEAEKVRPGLNIFTDRSRLNDGAARYVVVWKKGQTWAVPPLVEEPAHPAVLVVLVQDSDSGTPLQGVSGVEGPTENSVG